MKTDDEIEKDYRGRIAAEYKAWCRAQGESPQYSEDAARQILLSVEAHFKQESKRASRFTWSGLWQGLLLLGFVVLLVEAMAIVVLFFNSNNMREAPKLAVFIAVFIVLLMGSMGFVGWIQQKWRMKRLVSPTAENLKKLNELHYHHVASDARREQNRAELKAKHEKLKLKNPACKEWLISIGHPMQPVDEFSVMLFELPIEGWGRYQDGVFQDTYETLSIPDAAAWVEAHGLQRNLGKVSEERIRRATVADFQLHRSRTDFTW